MWSRRCNFPQRAPHRSNQDRMHTMTAYLWNAFLRIPDSLLCEQRATSTQLLLRTDSHRKTVQSAFSKPISALK